MVTIWNTFYRNLKLKQTIDSLDSGIKGNNNLNIEEVYDFDSTFSSSLSLSLSSLGFSLTFK